jgi:hypothetical protein
MVQLQILKGMTINLILTKYSISSATFMIYNLKTKLYEKQDS